MSVEGERQRGLLIFQPRRFERVKKFQTASANSESAGLKMRINGAGVSYRHAAPTELGKQAGKENNGQARSTDMPLLRSLRGEKGVVGAASPTDMPLLRSLGGGGTRRK